MVALKLRQIHQNRGSKTGKQERRGGIETGSQIGDQAVGFAGSRNAVVALKH